MSILWGVAALAILVLIDGTVRLLLISLEVTLLMGSVTRNAACPAAVQGQIF
jgi:hypothetical protein